MEYFHLGIFVIPRVYLIRKYGSQTQAFCFVFHTFFDTVKVLEPKIALFAKKTSCSHISLH